MNKDLKAGLVWGGSIVVAALVAKYAQRLGYVDRDTVLRLVIGLNGVMVAAYGNRIPKVVVSSAVARQAKRVSGWTMVLSGLVYTALWAFAPIPVAITVGTAAIAAGFVVTLGYCLLLHARTKVS